MSYETTEARFNFWWRLVLSACAALLVASVWVTVGTQPVSAGPSGDEAAMLNVTNNSRAAAGLPPLQYDPAASQIAQSWSNSMASDGALRHNPSLASLVTNLVTPDWTRIGENVGYGGNVDTLQNAFMASTGHRANVLGDYNRVGIGAVRDGAGTIWITLDFVKGPALSSNDPFGSLDLAIQVRGGIRVMGWAVDPDTSAPIEVHVYVDATGTNLGSASASRPDVAAAYSQFGSSHGFDAVVGAGPGWHKVCAYGINVSVGTNRMLGCGYVLIDPSPIGSAELAVQVLGGIRVAGWTLDPDTASPIGVHVYVDSWGTSVGQASDARPDVGGAYAYAGYGSSHGFDAVVDAGPGVHRVCIYGINVSSGANRAIGCTYVTVDASPFGSSDQAVQVLGGIRVSGWAVDPDTASTIGVHVYVDSRGTNIGQASDARPDVGNTYAYAGYGSSHGFNDVVNASPGYHNVCAYGINVSMGANRAVGCRLVLVDPSPFGSLDGVVPASGGIRVTGWAIDPDTASPIPVHVYVDSKGVNIGDASGARSDVGNAYAYAGYGSSHGFNKVVAASSGTHQVCAYGINTVLGANRLLGCRTVVVG